MKGIFLSIFATAAVALPTLADTIPQAETDSIAAATDLDEIVVQGRTQRVIKHGVEYTPDEKMKRAAADASSLLLNMQIPLLKVSPTSGQISKFTGGDASLFINHIPASQQELNNMRTEDVLRVEVLEYPSDPRFGGAQFVVNFIMKVYEWGGYTSINLKGTALGADIGQADLFSRFVYKKMTYDLSTGASMKHYHNGSNSQVEHFRDIMFNGSHYDDVVRDTHSLTSPFSQSNNQWVNFRAQYATTNFVLIQNLSFNRYANHDTHQQSEVTFLPEIVTPSTSKSADSSNSITPAYTAYAQITMPKGNSLMANLELTYSHNRSNSMYELLGVSEIDSRNKENAFGGNASLYFAHQLPHNNTFRIGLMSYNTRYRTRYMGSYTDLQRLLSSENMLFLEYMQTYGGKWNLYTRAGVSYVIGRVNDVNELEQWNPRMGFQLQHQTSSKLSWSVEGWWGNSHPHPSAMNSAKVQSNELMWLQGNPDLRNTLFVMTALNVNYIPCETFSLAGQVQYEGNPSRQAYEYHTEPGYDGLIRKTINSGDAHSVLAIANATLKLFEKKLMLNANGMLNHTKLTGLAGDAHTMLRGGVAAAYYFGPFSATLFYNSPLRSYNAWTAGQYVKYSQEYGLRATFGNSHWNATLAFNNWFNKEGYEKLYASTPLYSMEQISLSGTNMGARNIQLTVKYTFGYGKQVRRGNELGEGVSGSSAILR